MDNALMNIVIASDNKGKIKEIEAYLHDLPLRFSSQSAYAVPSIEETGLSFIENALLKARNASQHTNLPALGDDSGLAVHALGGEPGIYSARYAGIGARDEDNIQRLLQKAASLAPHERHATFYCALAFVRHPLDPIPLICLGEWDGTLLEAPRGQHGFGYDPIFYVSETHCSAAELSHEQKHQLSHRAKAFNLLLPSLRRLYFND